MKRKIQISLAAILGLIFVISAAAFITQSTSAQEAIDQETISASTLAGSTFTYQGRLTDGGSPATGLYDFRFLLFDAPNNPSNLIGSSLQKGNIQVTDGLFIVELDFGQEFFDGTALWLEIRVRPGDSVSSYTTLTPRQSLTATPYALSLVPGAEISADVQTKDAVLMVTNTNSSDSSGIYGQGVIGVQGVSNITNGFGVYGLHASASGTTPGVYGGTNSNSSSASGVFGEVTTTTPGGYSAAVRGKNAGLGGNGIGVWGSQDGGGWGIYGTTVSGFAGRFTATGAGGVGVYAQASSGADPDLILGGNTNTNQGDDGVISSDPLYPGSDIFLRTNDAVVIELDHDGNGEDADFMIQDKDGNLIFNVDESGAVTADGSFSSPAADFAEMLPGVKGLEPGDVLAIAPDGQLTQSNGAYQTSVVGVYSTEPGFVGGFGDSTEMSGKVPLAILGVVPVKASAENGAIIPGDLLVTASTPGHAMKAGPNPPVGTIIGKALTGLEAGTDLIMLLVTLQ